MKQLSYTLTDIEEMTYDEVLNALAEDFDKEENDIPLTGNAKRPTEKSAKAYLKILVDAREQFLNSIESMKPVVKQEESKTESPTALRLRLKQQKRQKAITKARKKLNNLIRLIITDNDPMSTLEDAENVIDFKTYGNSVIGFHTAKVVFGREWFLPELLVDNLRQATYTPAVNVKNGGGIRYGKPVPRYNIQELPLPTKEEIEAWKTAQAARANI